MIEQNYVQMNRFFQNWQRFNKIWKDFSKFSYFNAFSQHWLTKHIVSKSHDIYFNLVHNLVKKIYVKMSKIWKKCQNFKKKTFFMNFRDIFMWVMVDENTSPGSVLDTISWSESSCGKKPPSFLTSRKFTHFFSELLNLIQYFRNFGQQVLT